MSVATEKMSFEQLRKKVAELEDTIAYMKRTYEDLFYNLDEDNLGVSLTRKGENMQTSIEQTEEQILLHAEKIESGEEKMAELSVRADGISSTVTKVIAESFESDEMPTKDNTTYEEKTQLCLYNDKYYYYSSFDDEWHLYEGEIKTIFTQTADKFEMTGNVIISGDLITGGTITGTAIKMDDGETGISSTYNGDGLMFFDSLGQAEGWAIKPNQSYGGTLKYYVNSDECYVFGAGYSGTGYSLTDMVIKAVSRSRGRFVVDVSESSYPEVKLVGLNDNSSDGTAPRIFANEQLLATQEWVQNNARATAVFA